MADRLRDLRKVSRALALDRWSRCCVLLGLAVALAGTASIFSVVRPVLFQRPPFEAIERLVLISEESSQEGGIELRSTAASFERWDRDVGGLAGVAAACAKGFDLRIGDQGVRRVTGAVVTPDFFELLGVRPAVGRVLTPEDAGAGTSALITRRLADRLFSSPADALGSTLTAGDETLLVVGVLGAHQPSLPAGADLWVPARTTVPLPGGFLSSMEALEQSGAYRSHPYLLVAARLEAGADPRLLAETLAAAAPAASDPAGGERIQRVTPLVEHLIGPLRAPLKALLAAAGLLFALALLNASSLLVARGVARRREAAILISLGAPRRRLAAAVLTESLVLSLTAVPLGLAIAAPIVAALRHRLEPGLNSFASIRLDAPVAVFALALALAAGAFFGAVSIGALSRAATTAVLGDAARSPRKVRPAWGVSMVAQVGVAVVLSAAATLVGQRLHDLGSRDVGFAVEELSVIGLVLSSPVQTTAFHEAEERLASWPGVAGVARSSEPPLAARPTLIPVTAEDRTGAEALMAGWHAVSPSYFATLDLAIEHGRAPAWADAGGTARVAVISHRVAESLWPNRDPLGRRLTLGQGGDSAWVTVVGVAAEAVHRGLRAPAGPDVYYLLEQNPQRQVYFLVAHSGERPFDLPEAQRMLTGALPGSVLVEATTLEATRADQTGRLRLVSGLLTGFSLGSWLLAGIGLYGLLSFLLAQRRREIGIRLALGAGLGTLRAAVLVPGLTRVGAGLVVGAGLGSLMSRALGARIEDLPPLDLQTLGWVTLTVGAFAIAAMAPALRRARRIDPWQELRA